MPGFGTGLDYGRGYTRSETDSSLRSSLPVRRCPHQAKHISAATVHRSTVAPYSNGCACCAILAPAGTKGGGCVLECWAGHSCPLVSDPRPTWSPPPRYRRRHVNSVATRGKGFVRQPSTGGGASQYGLSHHGRKHQKSWGYDPFTACARTEKWPDDCKARVWYCRIASQRRCGTKAEREGKAPQPSFRYRNALLYVTHPRTAN